MGSLNLLNLSKVQYVILGLSFLLSSIMLVLTAVFFLLSIGMQNMISIISSNLEYFLLLVIAVLGLNYSLLHFGFQFFIQRALHDTVSVTSFDLESILQKKQFNLRLPNYSNSVMQTFAAQVNQLLNTLEKEIEARLNLARLSLQDQMQKSNLTQYDKLTGLPNRLYFTQTLQNELIKANKAGINPALILIDLNEFKSVNDVHGLAIGDALLIAVGKRLSEFTINKKMISRLSSDEFLLYVGDELGDVALIEYANDLVQHLIQPYQIEHWQIQIAVTAGLALAKDADYDLSTLLANVDIAQQYAKQHSKQAFCLYTPSMKAVRMRQQQIANSIISAIAQKELSIYYQAKVDCKGKVMGFEALVRWHSAELGFLPPDDFIPIAESSGKIRHITNFVIDQAFADIPKLINKYGQALIVSINLSAIDLKANTLLNTIEQSMLKHRVNAKNVEFEITESSYLENIDQVNNVFDALHTLGCSLALDDFGTGYSSLSYLTKIRVDVLKLDKQFVDEIERSNSGSVIIKCVVDMAKELNMKVCAEGVESLSQANTLLQIGCDQLQGYHYSVPAPLSKHINE